MKKAADQTGWSKGRPSELAYCVKVSFRSAMDRDGYRLQLCERCIFERERDIVALCNLRWRGCVLRCLGLAVAVIGHVEQDAAKP